MLHFVTSYMKQNKSRKQTLESAQYGLEISFKASFITTCQGFLTCVCRRTTCNDLHIFGEAQLKRGIFFRLQV